MPRSFMHWCASLGTMTLGGCLLLADPPILTDDPPADGWIDLAYGGFSACVLHAEGSLWCGDPSDLRLEDRGPFVAIGQGDAESLCAVREAGGLVCGFDGYDDFELEGPFVDVSGDENAGCGLLDSGEVRCWPEQPDVSGPFTAVGAGGRFACGIREGSDTLACWSIDDVTFEEALTDVPQGVFRQAVTLDHFGCALAQSGEVRCWGYDSYDLVGGPPPGRYLHVTLQLGVGCAVSEAGPVECWGDYGTQHESQVPSLDDGPSSCSISGAP